MAQQSPAAKGTPTTGTLRVGDRIALYVAGNSMLTDTFTVHEGSVLQLPSLPAISLYGVQRAQLQGYLNSSIKRYIKTSEIRATPLIRIGVLGEVNRPGFYTLPSDALLSDVLMTAGGLTQRADLKATQIRRVSRNVTTKVDQGTSVLGMTIGDLVLDGGDQISIGERGESTWRSAAKAAAVAIGLGATVYGVRNAGN